MTESATMFSLVIPSYMRGDVLPDTLALVERMDPSPDAVWVMDQTPTYPPEVFQRLEAWFASPSKHWIRMAEPSIPAAMNEGLRRAATEYVLFLDDDVVPAPDLLRRHLKAFSNGVGAVCGQVLQPGEEPVQRKDYRAGSGLAEDVHFPFHSSTPATIANVMAGNLSVRRSTALDVGGFDERFIGAAYRFETDFARRLNAAGYTIRFEPSASVRHLRLPSGGTRSGGNHLQTPSPLHSRGDYYFSYCHGGLWEGRRYRLHRLFASAANRYHLFRPWRVPRTLWAELRGWRQGAKQVAERNL